MDYRIDHLGSSAIELYEFLEKYHLQGLIWTVIKWTILGLTAGLLLGIAVFLLIRSLKGYRLEIKAGKWLRALVCVLTIIISMAAWGYAGLWEGLWRGFQEALENEDLSFRVFTRSGQVGSLLFAGIYTIEFEFEDGEVRVLNEERFEERLRSFIAGEWEMNVPELMDRIDLTTEKLADPLARLLSREAVEIWPTLAEGIPNKMLNGFLTALGRAAAHQKLSGEMDRLGVVPYYESILSGITAEASRKGDPETISFGDLSDYIAEQQVSTVVFSHARGFIRSQQINAMIGLIIFLALSVIAFRIGERMRQRTAESRENVP